MSLCTYNIAKPLRRSSSIVLRRYVFKYIPQATYRTLTLSTSDRKRGNNFKRLLYIWGKISIYNSQCFPAAAPSHPWVWPDAPLETCACWFAGPFLVKMFFILVDTHSKWPEVVMMSSTTSLRTIEALRSIFSQFGLQEQLVSDNGLQFTSEEFSHFMKANGVKHILSAPYHPLSNGFVQTFKRAKRAGERDGKSLTHQLAEFLFSYRSNVSPSELFLI